MATQPYILSFDEAKRSPCTQPRPSFARDAHPRARSDDALPAFESPFRRQPDRRDGARTSSAARTSRACGRPSSARAIAQPAPSSTRRAQESRAGNRFAPFGERVDERVEEPEEELQDYRLSRKEQRKKSRAKNKADRAFAKHYGGAKSEADAAQTGSRAAVYKGEMGAKHRLAARMQNAESPQASTKRRVSVGSFASLKSSPKFIASAAVTVCLALSCVFLYSPARQYYQAVRQRDQLAAEYTALQERNDALASDVSSLQTEEGVQDRAHDQFGWVKKDEETASVRGLDLDASGTPTFRANITPDSVELPKTWYSPFLDPLFGVG